MKLLKRFSANIMILFVSSILWFSLTVTAASFDGSKIFMSEDIIGSGSGVSSSSKYGSPAVSGMATISRPSEIATLEKQDIGMIFNKAKWDSITTITVPEKGWVIMDTTYDPWIGGIAVFLNPSMSIVAERFSNGRVGGLGRSGFYLEKGTYAVQAYDGGGGNASFSSDLEITVYAYFMPSSKVLSTSVSLSPDYSSATLHCTSAMGDGTLYRWVKDVSTTDNIKDDMFYSNKNAIGDIDVEENGTYSVRISTNDQEWKYYPVDAQVTVSGIVSKPVEKEPADVEKPAETIPNKPTPDTTTPNTTTPNTTTSDKNSSGVGSSGVSVPSGNLSSVNASNESLKTIKVKLNAKKNVTAKKGQKLKVKVKGVPKKKKVTFKSSNKKIATVNSKGIIKIKKVGKTTITVKCGTKVTKITIKVK